MNADEMYAGIVGIPREQFRDGGIWDFAAKKKANFPCSVELKDAVIKFRSPPPVICNGCGNETDGWKKVTIDPLFSACAEVKAGAFCEGCCMWTFLVFRVYPDGRILIMTKDGWEEIDDRRGKPSLVGMALRAIGRLWGRLDGGR